MDSMFAGIKFNVTVIAGIETRGLAERSLDNTTTFRACVNYKHGVGNAVGPEVQVVCVERLLVGLSGLWRFFKRMSIH